MIAASLQYDDTDFELLYVLLKVKIPIRCNKNVELGSRQRQELAVLASVPTPSIDTVGLVAGNVLGKTMIDALVEKQFHFASASIRTRAASRNATAWSRDTLGNPSRNSSIVSPASR